MCRFDRSTAYGNAMGTAGGVDEPPDAGGSPGHHGHDDEMWSGDLQGGLEEAERLLGYRVIRQEESAE
jgi:hypothetical protein